VKRNWRVFYVVAIVSLLLLAACSGGNDEGNSNSNDEEITLKFVHWINEDNGKWEPLIEKYEEQNPGIKVESIPLVENMDGEDYFKQLDLMASTGDDFDIMMFNNPDDLVKRIDAGLVEPINSYLDEEGIDIDEVYRNSYPPIDGDYYGLPMKNITRVIMMNKDHLDEAGLEIPTEWTWDDYREYAEALTTEDRYGSYLHTWHHQFSVLKILSDPEGSGLLINEDGSSNTDNPLLRESLELRYDLEQVDQTSVPFSEILSQEMDYRQQLFSEEVSMIPTQTYMVSEWGQFTPEFEIAWAPWPQNELGDTMYSEVGGDLVSIAQASEHKQEAYDFIRWLSTEGIQEQGIWVPSWKEADLESSLEDIVSDTSNPEANHMESLIYSINSVEPIETFIPPAFQSEAVSEFEVEVEKYLLDEQDLDTTMENIHERVQKVVDANQ